VAVVRVGWRLHTASLAHLRTAGQTGYRENARGAALWPITFTFRIGRLFGGSADNAYPEKIQRFH
jgi:hypothetical protein